MQHSATLPPSPPAESLGGAYAVPLQIRRSKSIGEIDGSEWNGLVSQDSPHLRYGFLAALESSGQCRQPYYFQIFSGGHLLAVAVAYHLKVDLLTLAPRRYTQWINAVRARLAPNLFYLSSLTCGPIVTNCNSNVYLSPLLDTATRDTVTRMLIESIQSVPDAPGLILFFEFNEAEATVFDGAFAHAGFLKGASLPGTLLDVRWKSIDEYAGQMRKAFRRTVVKDRARAENLEFEVVDDFSEMADEAYLLYRNVVRRAENVLQELTPEFFREIAAVEESRLVVARDRETRRIVGIELLLCGNTVLQDIFTGLDYSHNADQHLYFNLIYPVIDFAGKQGFRRISLGQTSYTFKSRLGVRVLPLWLFVKHRSPLVQRVLVALKTVLFPETPTVSHHVFRDEL